MVELIVYLVVLVIVVIFLWWLLQQVPLPEPLGKIATIVLVAIGVLVLIGILFQFAGGGGFRLPREENSMKVVTFQSAQARAGQIGVGVSQVVKVERLDEDESTITLTDSQSVDVKGTVAEVIQKLNAED
jgi:hypothetical protein